jgi:hypothetical protein
MSASTDKMAAHMQAVQRLVREKTGLDLSEEEITRVHLLSLEPARLAKSVVFSLTGNPLDLAEPGDDEREAQSADKL